VTLEDAERSHILLTLRQTEGLVGGPNGAAARLGLCRTTLISKMKRLGILTAKDQRFK
jgi:formate hydrogenlyase transcriptional activator